MKLNKYNMNFYQNIKCFFGFHKWVYGGDWIKIRECKCCNKKQVKKPIPPCYSLIPSNFEWVNDEENKNKISKYENNSK